MRIPGKLVLIAAVISTPAFAANLFVPDQHPTIQAAVDAASPGDRILVGAGYYAGARINKSVKISGEGGSTVINERFPGGLFPTAFEIVSGADKTEISDVTIELPGSWDELVTGIFVSAAAGPNATKCSIRNVRFSGLTRAIRVSDTSGWIIMDNTIEGLKDPPPWALLSAGIWMSGSGNSMIANNTILHNGLGIPGKIYIGINLSATPGTGPVDNNKIVNNVISIQADGARKYSDIELFQVPFGCVDTLFIVGNKIISNDASTVLLTPLCLAKHNVVH